MRANIVDSIRQVIGFLRQGIDFEADRRRAFERQLTELIEPHMPVLVHRRAKLLDSAGSERWSDELALFMQRSLWPLLGEDRDFADRNRVFVTLILDVAIQKQQLLQDVAQPSVIPHVQRFSAGWAT